MSGETEKAPSGWTVDSAMAHLLALREADRHHYDAMREGDNLRHEQRFVAQEKAVTNALASSKEAVTKADTASEKRFDSVNEFRQMVNDVVSRMMPRTEAESGMATNAEKIDALAARIDRTEGRSGGLSQGWGYLVGAVGLLATFIAIFFALSK